MMDEKRLDFLLECSVCLERLDERSKVLPCQHTFCTKCLTIILETRGHVQCPECRADYPNLVISKLPKNVLLVRILDNLKNIENKDVNSSQENSNKRDDITPKDTAKRLSAKIKYQAQINQPCARGLYNFSSTEEGDLPFKKGDIVSLAHEIDANWYEGFLGNKRGSIPKNFLETLVPLPKIDDDTLKNPFAKALYSYCKEEPELISFREGDIIGVIKKVDSNWFEGILGGQYGIFPFNFVQLNKAAKDLVSGDSSPSTSSSDDEIESTRKKRSKRARAKASPPTAAIAAAATSKDVFGPSPWVKRDQVPTTNDPVTKRHTIHIENPDEQQRQSRRALNLSDNVEQPQIRTRAMSQGRKPSESSSNESRTLASTVLLSRALRNSDEQLQLTITTAQTTVPSVSATTGSIPAYRTSENLSRSLSTSPSNSIPNAIGTGEMYTALFTYSPARDDELALIQGDQYWLIEKHLDGWFKGIHVRSQQTGVFPGNYVKLSSQVTQQMLRNIGTHPSRAVIGYGSNPSSPNVPTPSSPMFNFPPQRMNANNEETSASGNTISASGENSSPRSSGVSGFMKMFKKNKTKRQTPPTPATPQSPPSYYHSSMPGPMARPSPNVPAEPPPPYTPTPITTLSISTNDDVIINTSSTISTGEKFRAVASYPALHENELALRLGDLVWVTKKHVDGWYTGKSARTGTTGVFPSTFVEPQQ